MMFISHCFLRNILFSAILGVNLNTCAYAQEFKNLSEIEILRNIPQEAIEDLMLSGMPDEKGMVGRNRLGWVHVSLQRGVILSFVAAIAADNLDAANKTWNAIEISFLKQLPEGNFESGEFEGKKIPYIDDISGVSFWLAGVSRAILVVRESQFADIFKERIQLLLPKIDKAAQWLLKHKEELKKYDSQTANRLFFDALAFGLCGLLLDKKEFFEAGDYFLRAGLALQRGDGVLLEKGGYDSSYQATSLINMLIYRIYFPNKELEKAIAKGIQWEMSRIDENGKINTEGNTRIGSGKETFLGKRKEVSYKDVFLSLFFYGICTDNLRASILSRRVYSYAKQNR